MADVVIVGAGPAGIFAAQEIDRLVPGLDVVIVEQGRDIKDRTRSGQDILMGWGGAGAFSDGKLTIATDVGGHLGSLIGEEDLLGLLEYVEKIYSGHLVNGDLFDISDDEEARISARARFAGMLYVPTRIRHIGTENCYAILREMRDELQGRIKMRFNTHVEDIVVENECVRGVVLDNGEIIDAQYVICAPGRVGSSWMASQAGSLGVASRPNPVDMGVRVELPSVVMEDLTSVAYETKFIYYSKTFDDPVRTFCMNPHGEVVRETIGDLVTVNGHSWANKKTSNTNFAILVSSGFTRPFDDPNGFGRFVAGLVNMLGKGVIVQRLGDLLGGRRTTSSRLDRCTTRPTLTQAEPGDLSYCIPYRILTDILEMLACLDDVCPGVNSKNTLLYGLEVKFYSNRILLDKRLQTGIKGFYVIGDGAGITRGLMQASCSGVVAARSVAEERGHPFKPA
ncbi:MAG: FAD-dependent oxidoreductase [Thermodesulfobacteriota bacterium]|nr:FAD-dependent oxidoreductase [Thermodesulfobacteriota bacterium]